MNEFEAFRLVWVVYFCFGLSAMWIPYSGWSDVLLDNRVDVLVAVCSVAHQTLAFVICGGNKYWPALLFLGRRGEAEGFVCLGLVQAVSAVQLCWGLFKFYLVTSNATILKYVLVFSTIALCSVINLGWSTVIMILVVKKRVQDRSCFSLYEQRNQAIRQCIELASAKECLDVLGLIETNWGGYNQMDSLSENSFLIRVYQQFCSEVFKQDPYTENAERTTCSICSEAITAGEEFVRGEYVHTSKHTDCTVRLLMLGTDTAAHRRFAAGVLTALAR